MDKWPFQKRKFFGFETTRSSFKCFLSAEECVIADKGSKKRVTLLVEMCQQGMRKCKGEFERGMKQLAQERKFFFALRHTFRHSHLPHASCWHAVSQLTALMIQYSEPLFPWATVSSAVVYEKCMTRITCWKVITVGAALSQFASDRSQPPGEVLTQICNCYFPWVSCVAVSDHYLSSFLWI